MYTARDIARAKGTSLSRVLYAILSRGIRPAQTVAGGIRLFNADQVEAIGAALAETAANRRTLPRIPAGAEARG